MSYPDELADLSATELKQLIETREVSPCEVLESCITRIGELNPKINAFCATSFERARKEAHLAEQAILRGEPGGILRGLPIGIKDLEETEGLLTTYGSPLYRANVPAKDNELVHRLRQAGAIVVGKTNVPEMGAGANTRNAVWGATGNPFNPELNAGGSSGDPPPPWQPAWCLCAVVQTPEVHYVFRRPNAVSWVCVRHPAWCPVSANCWDGRLFPWSVRWAEM